MQVVEPEQSWREGRVVDRLGAGIRIIVCDKAARCRAEGQMIAAPDNDRAVALGQDLPQAVG